VFTSGKPHLTPNAQADPSFYDKVDQASHYRTEDMLAWPLTFRGQIVGVAQFLNKQGGGTFQPNDLRLAEVLAPSLAAKVADFVQSTENFEILGITLERESEQAAVFVCDLTNSSLLLNTLPTPVATDLINSYLELAADVTMRHGATIDQFLGDGAMIRFNVPRRVNGHVEQAIKAAQELQHRFDELKSQWTAGGYPVAKVYSRVGLASGPVYQVLMGHPQFQHLTLMGPTVSLANALCEAGDRTRNVILVNEEIAGQEIPPFSFAPVPREQMGKAARIVSVAYVVEGEAARVAVP
jgi:class 3 adenylate cyclase